MAQSPGATSPGATLAAGTRAVEAGYAEYGTPMAHLALPYGGRQDAPLEPTYILKHIQYYKENKSRSQHELPKFLCKTNDFINRAI
jgi:hypothetical protein